MVKFGLDLTLLWEFRDFDQFIGIASLAEKVGFDSLWCADHLMLPHPPGKGPLDVSTALAAVAAKTQKTTVGTKVVCVHFRHPGVIAKIGTTLDIVSGGRFILGVGAGWNRREFEAFGFPWEKRVARMREAIEIIKMLWTQSIVDYQGKFYRISKATSLPKPLQKPHPPIWIGSNGPRMLRLTAELGDGWITTLQTSKEYREKLDFIRKHAKKFNRTDKIEAAYYTILCIASTSEMAWKSAEEYVLPMLRRHLPDLPISLKDLEPVCIIGNPDECIDRIEEYIRAGAEHIIMKIYPFNLDYVKFYGDKVLPYFKETS